jgi:hypothetical protein
MIMIIEFLTSSLYDRSVTSFVWNEGRLEVDHAVMNLPKLLKKKVFSIHFISYHRLSTLSRKYQSQPIFQSNISVYNIICTYV